MGLIPFKKAKPHKTRDGKIALTIKEQKIDTIIDIGANRGQTHDILRANGFEGPIISVEPVPPLQDELQTKASKDPLWTVLPPLALGDSNGECVLNISEASDMSSVLSATSATMTALPKTKVAQQVSVPMKTLDTLYEELGDTLGQNVFIKIDAQGAEKMILDNAPHTLSKIKGLQVEMSLFPLYEGEALYDEIIALLKPYGFSPHMLVETNFSRRLNRQLQIDGIFYKD